MEIDRHFSFDCSDSRIWEGTKNRCLPAGTYHSCCHQKGPAAIGLVVFRTPMGTEDIYRPDYKLLHIERDPRLGELLYPVSSEHFYPEEWELWTPTQHLSKGPGSSFESDRTYPDIYR